MKRKIVAVFLALSLCFAGVVSAASIWGTYKGNNIIRLTVDGSQVKVSDVPAISYNGRTMIPIYLLQQAGVEYTWDSKNQTVDIQTNSAVGDGSLILLKQYSKVAAYYNKLNNLGKMLWEVGHRFGDTYVNIADNYNASESLQHSTDSLNNVINASNLVNKQGQDLIKENIPVDLSSVADIITYYKKAMDYYKQSLDGLHAYYSNRSDLNFDLYLDNLKNGDSLVIKGEDAALADYNKYLDLIQQM